MNVLKKVIELFFTNKFTKKQSFGFWRWDKQTLQKDTLQEESGGFSGNGNVMEARKRIS